MRNVAGCTVGSGFVQLARTHSVADCTDIAAGSSTATERRTRAAPVRYSQGLALLELAVLAHLLVSGTGYMFVGPDMTAALHIAPGVHRSDLAARMGCSGRSSPVVVVAAAVAGTGPPDNTTYC